MFYIFVHIIRILDTSTYLILARSMLRARVNKLSINWTMNLFAFDKSGFKFFLYNALSTRSSEMFLYY